MGRKGGDVGGLDCTCTIWYIFGWDLGFGFWRVRLDFFFIFFLAEGLYLRLFVW